MKETVESVRGPVINLPLKKWNAEALKLEIALYADVGIVAPDTLTSNPKRIAWIEEQRASAGMPIVDAETGKATGLVPYVAPAPTTPPTSAQNPETAPDETQPVSFNGEGVERVENVVLNGRLYRDIVTKTATYRISEEEYKQLPR